MVLMVAGSCGGTAASRGTLTTLPRVPEFSVTGVDAVIGPAGLPTPRWDGSDLPELPTTTTLPPTTTTTQPPPPPPPPSTDQLFETGSAVLRAGQEEVLLEYIRTQLLGRGYGAYRIRLIGHTDSRGSEAYNLKLSRDRALAVYGVFLLCGCWDTARVNYEGRGEEGSLVPYDEAVSARDRRVDIVVEGP
jgi:hypothetical protein